MINLTPHDITLKCLDGSEITFQPSGTVARVYSVESIVGTRDVCPHGQTEVDEQGNSTGSRIQVIRRVLGEAEGLPEEGIECLVSAMVLSSVPGRKGVYAPDSGPTAIRNEKGQVVAVTRLVAA